MSTYTPHRVLYQPDSAGYTIKLWWGAFLSFKDPFPILCVEIIKYALLTNRYNSSVIINQPVVLGVVSLNHSAPKKGRVYLKSTQFY